MLYQVGFGIPLAPIMKQCVVESVGGAKQFSCINNRKHTRFHNLRKPVNQIACIENSDGNTNVRFQQADSHKRYFSLMDSRNDYKSSARDIIEFKSKLD